jgi:hypothetical protein
MGRHRLGIAVALTTLLLLEGGELAIARANERDGLAFDDPATISVSDIPDLVMKAAVYSDPMDDVRRALLVLLRPTGRVAPDSSVATDGASPGANLPRAPPAA